MITYREMKEEQQTRVNDFLSKYAFFAFSEKQFSEGLKKLNIPADASGVLVSIGAGGYMLKDHAAEYKALAEGIAQERREAAREPEFAFQMFRDELADHEYCFTGRASDALAALGYDLDDINADSVLLDAFRRACEA